MANIVVVGAQWGDEAKGKIVDYLAHDAQMVVRYSGGNNAGHSVIVGDQTYKFHLVPAGILHPHLTCVISDGVVADPFVLESELRGLLDRGISLKNLKISGSCHVIMPYHVIQDQLEEEARGSSKIGTTGRGVGPAYADKAARSGIRMSEFVDPERFEKRLKEIVQFKNRLFQGAYNVEPVSVESILEKGKECALFLKQFVADTPHIIYNAAKQGGVIFEGAQGTLLDLDLGTYPYVTSSHPIAGGACLGTGVGPTLIGGVIGVAKSYTTRVGAGAFPTELLDDIGDHIREKGHEYGTTTGRPRRCGWLDTVVLRYSAQINGLTCLALGHVDVLTDLPEIKICTAYKDSQGNRIEEMPSDLATREDLTPIYEVFPGWNDDVAECKCWDDLPEAARNFVNRIEELVNVPICSISVGSARHQTMIINHKLLKGE